jgi:hypothetical protein
LDCKSRKNYRALEAVWHLTRYNTVSMKERRRRIVAIAVIAVVGAAGVWLQAQRSRPPLPVINGATAAVPQGEVKTDTNLAGNILETLPVKGRAPKTGYKRSQFGNGWADLGNCDMRNYILARDMVNVQYRSATDCTVMSGTLESDPYTGKTIQFVRGPDTSSVVQIEHIVALSDAWQKGAQQLSKDRRIQFANDPLELIAVDGPANNDKSDADAASWLPPNKAYRCRYIARQIAIKKKYDLWVTAAERDAMRRVLATCPTQTLPAVDKQ